MRAIASSVVLVVVAVLAAACSASEDAAQKLAVRALGRHVSTGDLWDQKKVDGGLVWRYGPVGLGSTSDTPFMTHLGVVACLVGDRASEAVRFSFLHWEPVGCRGGRARLRRVRVTPAQDERRHGSRLFPSDGLEGDPGLRRVRG